MDFIILFILLVIGFYGVCLCMIWLGLIIEKIFFKWIGLFYVCGLCSG